ncbi:Coenzyme A biosynthesis bifunctional protein CoaBC [Anatilimnocola aggregata]|uniref:Coenzyme A biosynthesis bifunctional protein CoaBC n=1 Tax=Anatilimnocola aggregata TaxID=2528021 RepID=A0A517YIP5_9BACT|nr:phosphopantothenoylcysteine decarboxylase [Anatilimnocola aggregata]QDU30086.1 Coenzyme A biosynthesis bifunctional protein CoaBC [Anatilimnocola aggregata]
MARILITSGPTRQYLDPVRYLTNGSSGRMGKALAQAALDLGHEVVIITGPVNVDYPAAAKIIPIISTEELLAAAREEFARCDGVIGAAAPCDYRPLQVETHKIAKNGQPLLLQLVETPDVIATLGSEKRPDQWVVGFALETDDARFRAITKLEKKHCDLIVLNGPTAMDAGDNDIELLDREGEVILSAHGSKDEVAKQIVQVIQAKLIAHFQLLAKE